MTMWGEAAANLAYMSSAKYGGDNNSNAQHVLEGLVFKGSANGERVANQQLQYQHASPDVADALGWFNDDDDALLVPIEHELKRPHILVEEGDTAERVKVAPVKRELKLSIDLPSKRGMVSDDWYTRGDRGRDAVEDGSDDPYLQLSPRSRRKRKNRDQMREARQKEKETMQKLRDTVERLEAKYIHTIKENEALAAGNGSTAGAGQRADGALRFPYLTSYTQSSAVSLGSFATLCSGGSASKYSELISAASRLKEENFRLKQTIHEKRKLQETLERHFSDFCESSPASVRDGIQHMDMGDSSTHEYYVPITTEESWMLIRDTHERVHAVQRSIAKRAQEEEEAAAASQQQHHQNGNAHKPSYFGWQIQYHTQDGVLLFTFEKPFYHVTALQAIEQMWTNERAMQSYRSARDAANQTLKIVQHINDDTYVLQRRMLVPASPATAPTTSDKYITNTYIRFRLKTARGYLVGQKSVDNASVSGKGRSTTTTEEQAEGVHWASKVCLWTEFIQESTPYGHEFCVVRVSGSINLQSGEVNGRVVAEVIIHLLRWETMTIGPVFTLSSG